MAVAAILFGVLLHFYRDASPSPSPNGTPQESATGSAGGRESEFPTVDWDYWKSVNGDVIGWITVPGTDINHPILQAHASDPDYYLHHDIYRNYNPLGALYLDAECEKAGFQSPNAVILGHSLRIGGAITCFGNIQNYSDKTFASEHAKVLIQTPEKKMRYTVRFANIVKGWEPTKRTALNRISEVGTIPRGNLPPWYSIPIPNRIRSSLSSPAPITSGSRMSGRS